MIARAKPPGAAVRGRASADAAPAEPRVVGPGFRERVYDVVRRVPFGKVTTYGDVATVLGSPRVARQVGYALAALCSSSPPGRPVPWHRVINAQGAISFKGQVGRANDQRTLLEAEGITFDAHGRVDLPALRFDHGWPRPVRGSRRR